MASTSSLGNASLTNASSAQAFYTHFHSATSCLVEELSTLSTQDSLQDALQHYARLNAELTAAVDSGVLPAYDQGVHKQRLTQVASVLEETRKRVNQGGGLGERKKVGFAFKRKQQPIKPATVATIAIVGEGEGEGEGSKQSEQPTTPTIATTWNHFSVASIHDTTYTAVSQPHHNESQSLSVEVKDISNSLVDLRPLAIARSILSVQLRKITCSIVLLPPIEGSIMIHDFNDSLLDVASCHQFRMHTSNQVVVELSTKRNSLVTVEACHGVKFIPKEGGERELRVQDFDDLINSAQLKRDGVEARGASSANFQVLRRKEGVRGMAERVDELLQSGSSIQSCLDKIKGDKA